jgi:hypothetical protein
MSMDLDIQIGARLTERLNRDGLWKRFVAFVDGLLPRDPKIDAVRHCASVYEKVIDCILERKEEMWSQCHDSYSRRAHVSHEVLTLFPMQEEGRVRTLFFYGLQGRLSAAERDEMWTHLRNHKYDGVEVAFPESFARLQNLEASAAEDLLGRAALIMSPPVGKFGPGRGNNNIRLADAGKALVTDRAADLEQEAALQARVKAAAAQAALPPDQRDWIGDSSEVTPVQSRGRPGVVFSPLKLAGVREFDFEAAPAEEKKETEEEKEAEEEKEEIELGAAQRASDFSVEAH